MSRQAGMLTAHVPALSGLAISNRSPSSSLLLNGVDEELGYDRADSRV